MNTNIKPLDFAGIYQIVNLCDGKRFIAQASNILNRKLEYERHRRANEYFNKAIVENGWKNYEFNLLERTNDLTKLNEREQFWIDTFKTYDEQHGYNIGQGPNPKLAGMISVSNPFYGKHHSEESKAKISRAKKGKPQTEETKTKLRKTKNSPSKLSRKIIQIDAKTKQPVKIWDSITEAAQQTGWPRSTITFYCQRPDWTRKGYRWAYAESSS